MAMVNASFHKMVYKTYTYYHLLLVLHEDICVKLIHKLDNCDVQKVRLFRIITRFEVIILVLKCKLNSLYNLDTRIGILGKTERLVAPEKPFTNQSHWCSIISPFSSTNSNHHNMFFIRQCCFLCNPFPAPSKTTGWCSTLALLRPFARPLIGIL